MQICKDHWAKCREAIQQRGLSHLVHQSGEAATEAVVRELEGTDTKADYDPLMNMNWAICGQYLKDAGLAGMVGDKCPLCEVDKSRAGLADNWINGASDGELEHARHLGLAPAVS